MKFETENTKKKAKFMDECQTQIKNDHMEQIDRITAETTQEDLLETIAFCNLLCSQCKYFLNREQLLPNEVNKIIHKNIVLKKLNSF